MDFREQGIVELLEEVELIKVLVEVVELDSLDSLKVSLAVGGPALLDLACVAISKRDAGDVSIL